MNENVIKYNFRKQNNSFCFWTAASEAANIPLMEIGDKGAFIRGELIEDNGALYKEMLEFFKNNNIR